MQEAAAVIDQIMPALIFVLIVMLATAWGLYGGWRAGAVGAAVGVVIATLVVLNVDLRRPRPEPGAPSADVIVIIG